MSFSTMQKKVKVLLVIRALSGRGGERSILTLAKGFHELGCKAHIVCFNPSQDYDLAPHFKYHLINIKKRYYKLLITTDLRYKFAAKQFDQYVLENIGQPDLTLSNLIQTNRIIAIQ